MNDALPLPFNLSAAELAPHKLSLERLLRFKPHTLSDREEKLLAELLDGKGLAIATGGGAVLSAATREQLRARAFVVHVQVGVEQQLARLERDTARPLLASGDRRETLRALALVRDPLYAEVADLVFASDGFSVDDAARRLASLLSRQWQRSEAA